MRSVSIRAALSCLLATAAASGVAGCSAQDDTTIGTVPGVDTGTLVQNWSIEGQRDTSKCVQYNADRMRVVVYDEDGSVHATEFAQCASFEIRLELRTRRYTGAATFLDVKGNPVSRTLRIPAFAIQNELSLTQNVDFSAGEMAP